MLSTVVFYVLCGLQGDLVSASHAGESLSLLQHSAVKQSSKARLTIRPESEMLDQFVSREIENNFANRQNASQDKWPERLQESIAKGKENPCGAPVLEKSTTNLEGLGWQMLGRMYTLALAVYGGFPYAIHIANNEGNLTLTDHFFKPVEQLGYGVCPIDIGSPDSYNDATPGYEGLRMMEALGLAQLDYVKPLLRFVTTSTWILDGEGKSEVEARIASLGLSGPYVGVHIRHGDKGAEAPLRPTGEYGQKINEARGLVEATAAAVQSALQRINSNTVFLATDDPDAKADLQVHLGQDVTIKSFPDKDAGSRSYNEGDAMRDAITDIETLRRSDLFVCTGSSSFAKVTWALRTGTPDDSDIINLEGDATFMTHQALIHAKDWKR